VDSRRKLRDKVKEADRAFLLSLMGGVQEVNFGGDVRI